VEKGNCGRHHATPYNILKTPGIGLTTVTRVVQFKESQLFCGSGPKLASFRTSRDKSLV